MDEFEKSCSWELGNNDYNVDDYPLKRSAKAIF